MATVHGKDTYVSVSGVDISAFCDSLDFSRGRDEHDVTTYGADGHVVTPGLTTGSVRLGGVYSNNTTATPRVVFEALQALDFAVPVVQRPEGTGSSLPERQFSAVFTEYAESFPVADRVRWTASGTVSGSVTTTSQ